MWKYFLKTLKCFSILFLLATTFETILNEIFKNALAAKTFLFHFRRGPDVVPCYNKTLKLAATLRGSRPGVQSASLIMTSLMT